MRLSSALTWQKRQVLVDALHVAAEVYRADAVKAEAAGQHRISDAFLAQVARAEALAHELEREE